MSNAQIIVPFDILEFKAGDCIEFIHFVTRIAAYLSEQDGMIEALQDRVDELEDENYNLQDEIIGLNEDIRDNYVLADPYTRNGVSPRDYGEFY